MGNNFQSQTAINEISAMTNVVNESIQKLNIKSSNESVNMNKVEIKVCESAIIQGDLDIDIRQKIKSFNKLDSYSVIQTISQNWNEIQNSLQQIITQLATSKQGWLSFSENVSQQYQKNLTEIFNEIVSRTESQINDTCQQYIENFNNGKVTICGVIKGDVTAKIDQDIYTSIISSCVIDSLFSAVNQNYIANTVLQRGDQIAQSVQEGITGFIFALILLALVIGAIIIVYIIIKKNREKELKKQEMEMMILREKISASQSQTTTKTETKETETKEKETKTSATPATSVQTQTSAPSISPPVIVQPEPSTIQTSQTVQSPPSTIPIVTTVLPSSQVFSTPTIRATIETLPQSTIYASK
jgi:hypothetical protein